MDLTQLLTLLGVIFAPVLSAIGVLFWLVWNERGTRLAERDGAIEERDRRIEKQETIITTYRESITPTISSIGSSMSSILDTQEKQMQILDKIREDWK